VRPYLGVSGMITKNGVEARQSVAGDGFGQLTRQRPNKSGGGLGGDVNGVTCRDEHLRQVLYDGGFPGAARPVYGNE